METKEKLIDIIVPCFNESEVLGIFINEIKNVTNELNQYKFQLIFVDDGSNDDTLNILKKFSCEYKNIKYISFSRNFGKESAMYAGLKNSTGDYAVIMDADMQNPPALLPQMIEAVDVEGYDCCSANRTRAGEPYIRTFFSRKFYELTDKISEVNMPDGAGDFRILSRKVINAILSMSEVQRFSKGIFSWVGFNTKWIYFDNVQRVAGQSKWNFLRLFKYAIDGITSFSTFPLRAVSIIGVFTSLSAFLYLLYVVMSKIIIGIDVPGYTTIVTLILFIGGIIILSCGLLGEYIAKIYIEVKNRPIYIVKESNIMNNIYEEYDEENKFM